MSKNASQDALTFENVETFTVTHPFSPYAGQTLILDHVVTRKNGSILRFRVGENACESIPASWTDYCAKGEYKVIPSQKSMFDYDDLVMLNQELIAILENRKMN